MSLAVDIAAIAGPAVGHAPVIQSDSIVFSPYFRALHCNATGYATLVDQNGIPAVYYFNQGQRLDVVVKQVLSAGSDGTSSFVGWL